MAEHPHEHRPPARRGHDASGEQETPETDTPDTGAASMASARSRAALSGIGLLAAGGILLAAQFGLIEFSIGEIITGWWPVLVIAYGVGALLDRHYAEGGVLTAVGVLLLASTTGVGPDIGVLGLVAIALIGAGIATVAESMTQRSSQQR